jgi:ABC-2 type transport system permease protein
MNDEAKSGAAVVEAKPSAPGKDDSAGRAVSIDWASLAPSTVGEVVSDAVKIVVFSLIVMNSWAVAHGCQVTTNIAVGGAAAGFLLTLGWKAYLALAEALGTRVLGATYAVIGIAACGLILHYASTGETFATSKQLKSVIQLLGLICLYPAALGLHAAVKDSVPESLNPMGFPFSPRWFATLWILFSKEVRTFFTSTIPYIVFFVFLVLNGYLFNLLIWYYTRPGQTDLPKPGDILFSNGFTMISLWFIWPAITMRLVAEEKRMGTIETLLTVPVTDVQVILAKFGAAMAFFAVMLTPLLAYIAILAQYARDWDWGPVFSSFLGLWLWGGLALSIGLFYSTLTESQLVAFVLAAFTNIILYFSSALEGFVKEDTVFLGIPVKSFAHYVAVHNHYQEFVKGIVSTQSVVFYLSITALGLFAAVRGLEAQRWK